jgi:hypothetical protein
MVQDVRFSFKYQIVFNYWVPQCVVFEILALKKYKILFSHGYPLKSFHDTYLSVFTKPILNIETRYKKNYENEFNLVQGCRIFFDNIFELSTVVVGSTQKDGHFGDRHSRTAGICRVIFRRTFLADSTVFKVFKF